MKKSLLTAILAATAFWGSATVVNIGYVTDTEIWPATGYKADYGDNGGFAVRIPAEMISPYAGSKVIGINVLMGDGAVEHEVGAFMRLGSLDSENVCSGEGNVNFGLNGNDYYNPVWDNVAFDNEWTIPADFDQDVYFGYLTYLPAGKHIPYISMRKTEADPNTVFMTQIVNGKEDWYDMGLNVNTKAASNLCIRLVVEMDEGKYDNVVLLENVIVPGVVGADKDASALVTIRNNGEKPASSVQFRYTLGDDVTVRNITFEDSELKPKKNVTITVPLAVLGTGHETIELSQVNGQDNAASAPQRIKEFDVVAVPSSVSENFKRNVLVEFYESETSHYIPNTQDAVIKPWYDRLNGNGMIYLPHHTGDKFSTNPADTGVKKLNNETGQWDDAVMTLYDADRLMLGMVDNQFDKVMMPTIMIDRSNQLTKSAALSDGSSTIPTWALYEMFMLPTMEEQFAVPTFAAVELASEFDYEGRVASITASGTIAPGILPEGENLKLTVVIVEENVVSDSQEFPQSADIPVLYPDGKFNHLRVVRALSTDFYGEEIAAGDFVKTYRTELEGRRWDADHMKVIAYLQRPETNGKLQREIINCTECNLTPNYVDSAIGSVSVDQTAAPVYYDINGRRVTRPASGLYIEQRGSQSRTIRL